MPISSNSDVAYERIMTCHGCNDDDNGTRVCDGSGIRGMQQTILPSCSCIYRCSQSDHYSQIQSDWRDMDSNATAHLNGAEPVIALVTPSAVKMASDAGVPHAQMAMVSNGSTSSTSASGPKSSSGVLVNHVGDGRLQIVNEDQVFT